MWTDYSIMGKFETGRVYVVYQDKNVSIFLDFFTILFSVPWTPTPFSEN